MRTLLIAGLLGLSGAGVGYWRFVDVYHGIVERFEDPIADAKGELEKQGKVLEDENGTKRARIEVVGGTEFVFGSMQANTEKVHHFVFKNVGNAPTRLEVVGTTCKCTIGELDNPLLEPGQETKVELKWKPLASQSDFSQTATIKTDDPDQLEIKLTVRGNVNNSIYLEPKELALGDFDSSDRVIKKVLLISCVDEPLVIKDISWGNGANADRVNLSHTVRAVAPGEFPDREDAKYVAEISIDLSPGLNLGNFSGLIYISTNVKIDQDDSPLILNVSGNVSGAVRIIGGLNFDDSKNTLNMGRASSQEGKIARISLGVKVSDGTMPTVEVASQRPADALKVRVLEPNKLPKQVIFPVELEVPKGAAPLSMLGASPSNFGKVEFRISHNGSTVIPLYYILEVTDR